MVNFFSTNKSMVNFVIHPGIVKTGTTFFQNNVVPNIHSTLSIGKPYNNRISKKIKKIFYSNKNLKNELKEISNQIIDYLKINQSKNIIFSDEILLDSEFYNIDKNFNKLRRLISLLKNKSKINLYILITIRSQEKLIKSRYGFIYPVLKNKYQNIDQYVFNEIKRSKFFNNLKYSNLEKKLNKFFKAKVTFLPLEYLENDKKNYKRVLIRLFGKKVSFEQMSFEKVNKLSENNIFYKRKGNLWFYLYIFLSKFSFIRYLKEIFKSFKLNQFFYKRIKFDKSKKEININPLTSIRIKKFYDKDNKILLKKHGIRYN